MAAVLLILGASSPEAADRAGRGGERAIRFAVEPRLRAVIDCMRRGRTFLRSGDYVHAAVEFEKALGLDPSNTSAAELLKRCEERLGAGGVTGER